MITNPLVLDNVHININMTCIGKEFESVVNRHTNIETIINEQYP